MEQLRSGNPSTNRMDGRVMPNLFRIKRQRLEWQRRKRALADGVWGPWQEWRLGAKWLNWGCDA